MSFSAERSSCFPSPEWRASIVLRRFLRRRAQKRAACSHSSGPPRIKRILEIAPRGLPDKRNAAHVVGNAGCRIVRGIAHAGVDIHDYGFFRGPVASACAAVIVSGSALRRVPGSAAGTGSGSAVGLRHVKEVVPAGRIPFDGARRVSRARGPDRSIAVTRFKSKILRRRVGGAVVVDAAASRSGISWVGRRASAHARAIRVWIADIKIVARCVEALPHVVGESWLKEILLAGEICRELCPDIGRRRRVC